MDAKIKAEELVGKFSPRCAGNSQTLVNYKLSIECAIICVDLLTHEIHTNSERNYFWQNVLTELKQMK